MRLHHEGPRPHPSVIPAKAGIHLDLHATCDRTTSHRTPSIPHPTVIPAKAGIQFSDVLQNGIATTAPHAARRDHNGFQLSLE
jgi:hypothetical protein